MKIIFLFLLIFSTIQGFAQIDVFTILDENVDKYQINWNQRFKNIKNDDDSNKVYILGFIVEPQLYDSLFIENRKIDQSWFLPYNVDRIYPEILVVDPITAKDFYISLPSNDLIPVKRSIAYLLVKNSRISDYLESNSDYFSVYKLDNQSAGQEIETNEAIFQMRNIGDYEEYKWRINHLIYNLNSLQLIENQKKKNESYNKSSWLLSGQYSFYSGSKVNSSLTLLNSDADIYSYGLQYNKFLNVKKYKTNSKFDFKLSFEIDIYNLKGSLKSDSLKLNWTDLSNPELPILRENSIYSLIENWEAKTAVLLNIGLGHQIAIIEDKILLDYNINLGQILPFNINSILTDGYFNYRGYLNGISDQIYQISSLGLLDNINYKSFSAQTNQFWGYGIGLDFVVNFKITNSFIFSIPRLNFDFIKLYNNDFNSNSLVSPAYGEFNSTLYNVKSFTFMPFSIGAGIGFKF